MIHGSNQIKCLCKQLCSLQFSVSETYLVFCVSNFHITAHMRGRLKYNHPLSSDFFFSQLVANAVLFACVNAVGVFHLYRTEKDLRISNQKREEFSAIRSQKEIKKYQQVSFSNRRDSHQAHEFLSDPFHLGRAFVRSAYLCLAHCSYLLTWMTQN